ncbi:MAG: DUF1415 family protein, partial [Polyangiaceae bacterium]|nr:DUF1415 family protein [Polyangiaceae bacterium]
IFQLEKDQKTELALLVFPWQGVHRNDFEQLLRSVRARKDRGPRLPFAMAAFHPNATLNRKNPEQAIPFFRRSPFPLIQAVRSESLEKLDPSQGEGTSFIDVDSLNLVGLAQDFRQQRKKSLRRKVTEANFQAGEKSDWKIASTIEAIHRERDQLWERLDHKVPPEWQVV